MSYVVAVECIIQNKDQFLLIKRPKGVHGEGLLSFPGGGVEYEDGKGNTNILEEVVKREMLEELKLNLIDLIQFVTSSYFIDAHKNRVLDVIFYCDLKLSDSQITAHSREVPKYFWLTFKEVMNHSLAPNWVKHYLQCINKRI